MAGMKKKDLHYCARPAEPSAGATNAAPPRVRGPAVRLCMLCIRLYQYTLSPLLPHRCRYHPTCSVYARQALSYYGFFKGSWYALRRILRCHPFGGHGHDPVRPCPAPQDNAHAAHSPYRSKDCEKDDT
jgi:hypothetical protein